MCILQTQYCSPSYIFAPGSQLFLRQHSHHIWKCQRQSVHVQVQFVPLSTARKGVYRVAALWSPSMRRGEAVLSAGEFQYQLNTIVVSNKFAGCIDTLLNFIQDSLHIEKHWVWAWSKWRHPDHGVSSQRYLTFLLVQDISATFIFNLRNSLFTAQHSSSYIHPAGEFVLSVSDHE